MSNLPGDNEPRMEVRALLAIVLSMLVLTVYQYFFQPPPPPPLPAAEGQFDQVSPDPGPAEAASGAVPLDTTPPAASVEPPPAGAIGADTSVRTIVESRDYSAVVTNVGARLSSFVIPENATAGVPLDLVAASVADAGYLPLEIVTPGRPQLAARANAALFFQEGAVTGETERSTTAPVSLAYRWAEQDGWSIEKTLEFSASGFEVRLLLRAQAPDGGPVFVALGPGLDEPVTAGRRNAYLVRGAAVAVTGDVERLTPADLAEPVARQGLVEWAGVESGYFLSAFLPNQPVSLRLDHIDITPPEADEDQVPAEPLRARLALEVPPGGLEIPIYLGPKRYSVLGEHGHGLQTAIGFGMWGFVARPLLLLLNLIHGFVSNYGIAIILLTLVLRIALFPLNHKFMTSMRKMQKIQPQVQAIQNKYKGSKDLEKKQRMQQEMMALYKQEGVSPVGGCVPMLMQFPLLLAMYALLAVAIELRGAPFFGWIQDLSQHDPYFVLPLLMGGAMVAQSRMSPTPSGGNPTQAMMTKFMPIMFTALFLYAASGLVLYWFVNNLLGIVQQQFTNRHVDGRVSADKPAPKGKRRKKGKQDE